MARLQRPVKSALPGPCSRKLATPIRESSEWNTSIEAGPLDRQPVGERRRTCRRRSPASSSRCASSAPRSDLGRQRERPLVQLVGRHDLVGQADPQRLLGAHLTAGEAHLLRPADADGARQPLRAAAAGDDAEQDLRLTEHGLLRGDPVVAGQRQLAAATERVAAHRGDHEPRDRGDASSASWNPAVIVAASSGPPNSEMSAPAAKIRSPPVITTRTGRIGGQRRRRRRAVRRAAPTTAR